MHYVTPNLRQFEKKIFSQFGEDGVIEELVRCLKIKNGSFLEFGIGPPWKMGLEAGLEGNLVHSRSVGWEGVFLDGSDYPHHIGVRREFIHALNINVLYRKHALPDDLDVLSIDVDGQEFWIWMALDYRPKIVITEYNGSFPPDVSVTMPFNPGHYWDCKNNNGASLLAFNKLALSKGYTFVYSNGVNAFFVRDDMIANKSDFVFSDLHVQAHYHPDDPTAVWVQI